MQIKKEEYLPNPALHAFEPLLNNFQTIVWIRTNT